VRPIEAVGRLLQKVAVVPLLSKSAVIGSPFWKIPDIKE
jgi:hypothetical protein